MFLSILTLSISAAQAQYVVELVEDINPDGSSNPGTNFTVSDFTVFGDSLIFTATDGTNPNTIWKWDGLNVSKVAEFFPKETRTSRPVGGSVLWLELPKSVNAETLFDEAIEAGISIAPGNIFSPCSCYANFIRLSHGHPWGQQTEDAIKWLGERVTTMSA